MFSFLFSACSKHDRCLKICRISLKEFLISRFQILWHISNSETKQATGEQMFNSMRYRFLELSEPIHFQNIVVK